MASERPSRFVSTVHAAFVTWMATSEPIARAATIPKVGSPRGVPMESPWSPHGVHEDSTQRVHGALVEPLWSPCGVPMESSWTP